MKNFLSVNIPVQLLLKNNVKQKNLQEEFYSHYLPISPYLIKKGR